MKNRLKHYDYEITNDQQFIFDMFGIPPELQAQFESLQINAEKGGKNTSSD